MDITCWKNWSQELIAAILDKTKCSAVCVYKTYPLLIVHKIGKEKRRCFRIMLEIVFTKYLCLKEIQSRFDITDND